MSNVERKRGGGPLIMCQSSPEDQLEVTPQQRTTDNGRHPVCLLHAWVRPPMIGATREQVVPWFGKG